MYVVELHDAAIEDVVHGTRAGSIGRKGSIDYPYQVEMHLQDVLDLPWRRAYLKAGERIEAIWARDMATGEVQYLARSQDYTGEWVLPFVGLPDARIAVGIWGRDATTGEEALAWATSQLTYELAPAITAIVLEEGEIRFAWEIVDGMVQFIAHAPFEPR